MSDDTQDVVDARIEEIVNVMFKKDCPIPKEEVEVLQKELSRLLAVRMHSDRYR